MLRTDKIKKTNLIGVILLIIALPVSLYLISHPQIFKGRATGTSGIVFLDQNNNFITQTENPTVILRLTYASSQNPGAAPASPAGSNSNLCAVNLAEGQTISGNVPVVVTGTRPDPTNYLSLQIANSTLGNFQVVSTQSDILFANIFTPSLFQNGQAAIECRIQEEPGGGRIISSKSININVQNP